MSDAKRSNDKPALEGDAPRAEAINSPCRECGKSSSHDVHDKAVYSYAHEFLPSLITYPAWEGASESQRKEWARSILAALKGSYDKLSPALREATKQALIDVS